MNFAWNLLGSLQQSFFRWALRGRSPELSPITLTRQRVYVLPTRLGLGYCVLLLVMLMASINYNLSLGYAMVFLLAGLGVVNIFHSFRNLAGLTIAPGPTPPCFAASEARFGLVLGNDRRRPRPGLGLNLPGRTAVSIDLEPESACQVTLGWPAPQRGWLQLPRLRLATTYPLGLIRAWAYAAPDLRCLVYPAPHAAPTPAAAAADEDAGSAGRAAGLEDFSGLRQHQLADPLRHVAWKAAAQREQGPLLTKLFDGGQARTVWFDWAALPESADLETRLSMLTRGVCDAASAGVFWGLRLPTTTVAPSQGEPHFHACLAALALYGQD